MEKTENHLQPQADVPPTMDALFRNFTRGVKMHLKTSSGVIIDSVKYACKDVFIVDYLHAEDISLFFLIKYILNINTQWLLCGKLLVPTCYDTHLHAFRVKFDQDWSVIKPGQEMDHQSLDLYHIDNKLYVILRSV